MLGTALGAQRYPVNTTDKALVCPDGACILLRKAVNNASKEKKYVDVLFDGNKC